MICLTGIIVDILDILTNKYQYVHELLIPFIFFYISNIKKKKNWKLGLFFFFISFFFIIGLSYWKLGLS